MLGAIPSHIPAIGTEIDPKLAQEARMRSGRPVIEGDFRTVDLPRGITAVFGNPPFKLNLFKELLIRCQEVLPLGAQAGFILPAYFLSYARTVLLLQNNKWGISTEILPRDIFPRIVHPLLFAKFIRDNRPQLVGFSLFPESAEIRELNRATSDLLATALDGPRSTWREVVDAVLTQQGGTASLQTIYRSMEGKRPTPNAHWKEKVRQILQLQFKRVSEGVYTNQMIAA